MMPDTRETGPVRPVKMERPRQRGQNLLSKLRAEVIIGAGWYEMIANLHDHRTERGRGMGLLGIEESRPRPTARRAWAR